MVKLNTLSKESLIQGIQDEWKHHIEAYEDRENMEANDREAVENLYKEFVGNVAKLGSL